MFPKYLISRYLVLVITGILLLVIFYVPQTQASIPMQYVVPSTISVKMFALTSQGAIDFVTFPVSPSLPDGPACINGSVTAIAYGCGTTDFAYPHPTNTMTVNLENDYLPFVIAQEMGYDALLEALRAHAVAARSYALHLFEFGGLNNSSGNQVFLPYSVTPSANHYQAANDTSSIIMVCNNDTDCEPERKGFPIFAEHSAGHDGDFTNAWLWNHITRHLYLARVYDAVHTTANGGHGRGMSQNGAKNWAEGVGENGTPFPPWDYRRILAHYYTAVEFEGLGYTVPYTYIFNVLEFGNLDDRDDNNPLILRKGHEYTYPFIVQNTGTRDWTLSCNGGAYNVALGVHWYSYPGKQYIAETFEGSRQALCPPGPDGTILTLSPGQEFPSQEGSDTATASIWVDEDLAPDGDYWLRLDVDFFQVAWGSGLHPQDNPNGALWPTQDIHVLIAPQSVSPPAPELDGDHQPGDWNNIPELAVSWPAVADPMGIDHYEYRWDSEDRQSTNDTTVSKTLSDGQHRFRVVAIANDGEESDTVTINDILIDATPPVAFLTALPERITTSPYLLTWSSGDSGGSGLKENQLRYPLVFPNWKAKKG